MSTNGTVKYVDFGYASANEYWTELVIPAHDAFRSEPNRQNAIRVSIHAWHLHDWIWHDQHPGEETRGNKDYADFQNRILAECPQLAWIRDVADTGKHRGLGRPDLKVRSAKPRIIEGFGGFGGAPIGAHPIGGGPSVKSLTIILDDGASHEFGDILAQVITYWRRKWIRDS